jgi:hypothetical protein
MPPPTPRQQLRRDRIEGVIRLLEPVLDFVLAAGDRVSRIGPEDHYHPIRAPGEAFELPTRRSQPSGESGGGGAGA